MGIGGSIHVENAPEGGAVFTLFFPLEESGETPTEAEPALGWAGEGTRPYVIFGIGPSEFDDERRTT